MTRRTMISSKDRRSKLELYYAVLYAIHDDLIDNATSRPTRIQFLVGTSYDKLTTYLEELEKKKLIVMEPLSITEKGQKFIKEYDKINELTKKLNLKFLQHD